MTFPRSIPSPRARHRIALEDTPYIAALVAAGATAFLTILLPREVVLPALSIVLLTLAFSVAAIARLRCGPSQTSSWYVSAALTFIGFGAAFLTDAEQVLPLLEGSRRNP